MLGKIISFYNFHTKELSVLNMCVTVCQVELSILYKLSTIVLL